MKKFIALLLAWFAFGVSVSGIAGHYLNLPVLASWVKGGTPMAVSTAVALIALSISVALHWTENHHDEQP